MLDEIVKEAADLLSNKDQKKLKNFNTDNTLQELLNFYTMTAKKNMNSLTHDQKIKLLEV